MNWKKTVSIGMISALALGLAGCGEGCGEKKTEVSPTAYAQMETMMETADVSEITLSDEVYPMPTDEKFTGTWSAMSEDETELYSITISTDFTNEETPYSISVSYTKVLEDSAVGSNWEMNAKEDPTNADLLIYKDATKTSYDTSVELPDVDLGDETLLPLPEPDYTDGTGSFLLNGDKMVWTDDKDKTAWDLFFTKTEEDDGLEALDATNESAANSEESETEASTEAAPAGEKLIEDEDIISEEDAEWDYDPNTVEDWVDEEDSEIEAELASEAGSEN